MGGLDIMVSISDKAALSNASIEDIVFDAAETKELDKLAERARKCGISWEDLKAELRL
jgi:hypothetical protein